MTDAALSLRIAISSCLNEANKAKSSALSTVVENDILASMGDRRMEEKVYGTPVNEQIELRVSDIVWSGIPEKEEKSLLEKYPTPINCNIIDPLKLNKTLIIN